jgi:hypothetical protein
MIVGRIAEEAGTMSDNVVLVLVLSCPDVSLLQQPG